MPNRRPPSARPPSRHGLAVAELAVTLPVLLIILLGTMELCTLIRVRQKLAIAAHEGVRTGLLPDATADQTRYRSELLCTDFGIRRPTVTLDPADPAAMQPGDWLTVEVTTSWADNSLVGAVLGERIVTQQVSMQHP